MLYDGRLRNEREVFECLRRVKQRRQEDGSMAIVQEQFIKKLQGRDFVLYDGLLDAAHRDGLKGIETEIVQIPTEENGYYAVMKAKATRLKRKRDIEGNYINEWVELSFDGTGDASPQSVGRNIVPHILRMAETRAKARALRDLCNIGMVTVEELGPDMEEEKEAA